MERLFFMAKGKNCSMTPTSETSQTFASELRKIATEYQNDFFQEFPEMAGFWGRQDALQDRFRDRSLEANLRWQNKEDQYLECLTKIPPKSLEGLSEFRTYELLSETLQASQQIRICRDELWSVDPLWGWHNFLSMLAEKQPVGSVQARSAAIRRWKTFGEVAHQEIKNLKEGLKLGYCAPQAAVSRVLKQVGALVETPLEDSPFFVFAKKDGDPEFKLQISGIIEQVIQPALRDYQRFLSEDYFPNTRTQIGISALPNGVSCYEAKLRKYTTLTTDPRAIHEMGLAHMETLKKEVAEIGNRLFGIEEIHEVFKQAQLKSLNYFQSSQDILKYNESALGRAMDKLSEWFEIPLDSPGVLTPYPEHRAKTGAIGEYHPPSDDGSRPGTYFINTYDPKNRSRMNQESTLFHELVPGHHYQVMAAKMADGGHTLDQYLWNSGYGEGWALYTERLVDEMGLYSDELSKLGMLSNEALRAARLVVDPGIHVLGWSREQALEYMKKHTGIENYLLEGEIDRYIMMPGQATSYMLGMKEIFSLRQMAKQKLGKDFDIRKFHSAVLKNGAVTLPMLRVQVENWISEKKSS